MESRSRKSAIELRSMWVIEPNIQKAAPWMTIKRTGRRGVAIRYALNLPSLRRRPAFFPATSAKIAKALRGQESSLTASAVMEISRPARDTVPGVFLPKSRTTVCRVPNGLRAG